MFLWIHYQYDDSQEQAGEKEEEVWGLVRDGGAHVQEKENRYQMDGYDFHESFLAQSSQVRIIWPRTNNLASRVERISSGGSAKDVNSAVRQANSRSEAFSL